MAPWKPNGKPVTDASDKQLLAHFRRAGLAL